MRVLLDTDVILDLLLDREPFAEAAAALWESNRQGRIEAYIAAITPVNVFYIARKLKGAETARQAVEELLAGVRVCALDQAVLQSALAVRLKDFEDAVQQASVIANQLDGLITRNLEDYRGATIPVFTPTDFLIKLNEDDAEGS
jgi:predicted nucleic acid-binding protein